MTSSPLTSGSTHRAPATIGDVAALAGVSIATVSRVLNGTKHVSEPTVLLVRDAADRLAYRPSRSAQLLARHRPRLIGLVISDLLNETLLIWARAAAAEAEALGYHTLLCDGRNSPAVEAHQLEQLLAARVEAICLVGPVAVPAALRDRIIDAGTMLTPAFMHDDATAMRIRAAAERPAIDAAVDLLVATGSTWIATAAAALDAHAELVFDDRRRAITARARRCGVRIAAGDHLGADPTELRALLARHRGRGALIALNHDLPGSIVATVLGCGRGIPDDVAVVAFGDSRAARTWTPQTTVITRDMDTEGRRHVRALVEHLEGRGRAGGSKAAPAVGMERAVLVERQTTPPRATVPS